MKIYFTFSRSALAMICAAVILTALLLSSFWKIIYPDANAETNSDRIRFAAISGITIEETAKSKKEITVPQEFSHEFEKYNRLQIRSGYNLEGYKGCRAILYTYKIADKENSYLNLLVYKNRVIGGDIYITSDGGKLLPLKNINGENYGKTKTG